MISWWRRKQRELVYRVIVLTAMQCGRNLSETQKLMIYNKCVGSRKVKKKKKIKIKIKIINKEKGYKIYVKY